MSDTLTLGALSLTSASHVCEDMTGVYAPPEIRGGPRTIPGEAGVRARKLVRGAARFVLPIMVFGTSQPDGTPYTDVREGLRINIQLLAQACLPSESPVTVTMTHTLPDGGTRVAQVQILGLDGPVPVGPAAARMVADVLVPSGTWTYTAAVLGLT